MTLNSHLVRMKQFIGYVCEALICKKALSVKIIGPLSPKALKCKKFGWPLSIIGLICKNDVGSNVLV